MSFFCLNLNILKIKNKKLDNQTQHLTKVYRDNLIE